MQLPNDPRAQRSVMTTLIVVGGVLVILRMAFVLLWCVVGEHGITENVWVEIGLSVLSDLILASVVGATVIHFGRQVRDSVTYEKIASAITTYAVSTLALLLLAALVPNDVVEGRNPRDIKVLLAQELVERFHSAKDAVDALADFEARFRQGALPDDLQDVRLDNGGVPMPIVQALRQAGLTASTSEAIRMIEQGGVRADSEKVADKGTVLPVGVAVVLQVGKRKFARVCVS